MADWFRCAPLPLLDALQELSEDAQLVYVKALLLIYHRDGRISATALRHRFPNWRPKRLQRAVAELLDSGKLIGTATGDLHNERALHELQQLAELTTARVEAGSKGGRTRAMRERQARRIAERNLSPDLFPNPVEQRLKPGSTDVECDFKSDRANIENDFPGQKANEINTTGQATLKHVRARETETELEEDTPHSAPPLENVVELVEGVVEDDEPGPRKRKQPMPPGWEPPPLDQLSPAVAAVVETWDEGELDQQRAKFVEWAEATDARFVRWDRAFGNWALKHHDQRKGKRHGRAAGFAVPTLGSR